MTRQRRKPDPIPETLGMYILTLTFFSCSLLSGTGVKLLWDADFSGHPIKMALFGVASLLGGSIPLAALFKLALENQND
jgi:hypothetical protein